MWVNRMMINLDILILDELAVASAGEGGAVVSRLGTNKTVYCVYACVCYESLGIFQQRGLIEL